MDKPLCPLANRIVGVLVGLWPRLCWFWFSVVCFAVSSGNASLAGGFAGRRVCGFLWFLFCLFRTACCSNGHFLSLYKCLSDSLCSCKDRAFSATSAKLEEKKWGMVSIVIDRQSLSHSNHPSHVYGGDNVGVSDCSCQRHRGPTKTIFPVFQGGTSSHQEGSVSPANFFITSVSYLLQEEM